MSFMTKIMVSAAAAGLLASVPASATELLTNGNFETGSLSSWTATGNVFVGAVPYYGVSGSSFGGFLAEFNGANTDPTGVLSQTIATTAGTAYNFTFDYAVTSNGNQSLTASVLNVGSVFGAHTVSTTSSSPSTYDLTFTALSDSTTIQFSDISTNNTIDQDIVVDNASVAAVPEPATWAMMLLGFGMVGFAMRSRRKTVVRVTYA